MVKFEGFLNISLTEHFFNTIDPIKSTNSLKRLNKLILTKNSYKCKCFLRFYTIITIHKLLKRTQRLSPIKNEQ